MASKVRIPTIVEGQELGKAESVHVQRANGSRGSNPSASESYDGS
jgi:hypothetical protein